MEAIFGDHMVLQCDKPIRVWGRDKPGNTVTVCLSDHSGAILSKATAMTSPDGRWDVLLEPVEGGRKTELRITTDAGEEKTFTDVLIGEVWLLSGQSNMRWSLKKSQDGQREVQEADHPRLRLFLIDPTPRAEPQVAVAGHWQVCTPESAASFSGPGYFFGRELMATLDRPVGLICATVGGTPIHPWIPLAALNADPQTAHYEADRRAYFAQPPEKRKKARGTSIYGAKGQFAPGWLFNGMIHPLIPLTMRGVAWCQGEANSRPHQWGGPSLYRTLFPMLIQSWRGQWKGDRLPFLYVELANHLAAQSGPVDEGVKINWADIREAQAEALALPSVFMVPAIDLGLAEEIHYPNKKAVGRRLAQAALGALYGLGEPPYLAPRLESHTVEGAKIRLRFSDAAGLRTTDGKSPATFAIKGNGKGWMWAEAAIEADEIVVWHPEISQPEAVRHAWASNPSVNVVNKANLPLSSFRIDKPQQAYPPNP